ncbi:hypothetical protein OE88DRAFT_1735270 [Heliocybe sulcata]|uniref:F-box domain-containing protein n=1 Tax=Heliocybe sulcata TaxID=5364 RepID=A0A5C3N5E0_9AGAM|nr:hypothetical protein OE88DRAFT_1735270 [Heliocybe sulcata]
MTERYRFRTLALTDPWKIQPFLRAFEDSAPASKRSVRHVLLTIDTGSIIALRWPFHAAVPRFLEAMAATVETLVLSTGQAEHYRSVVQALANPQLVFPRLTHLTLAMPMMFSDVPHGPASAPPFVRHELFPSITHLHLVLRMPLNLLSSYNLLSRVISLPSSVHLRNLRISGVSSRNLSTYLVYLLGLGKDSPASTESIMPSLPLSIQNCIIELASSRSSIGSMSRSMIPELTNIVGMNNEKGRVKFRLLSRSPVTKRPSLKEIWLQVQACERDPEEDWKLDSEENWKLDSDS